MKLIMTGLDWHKAPIDLREQLSFTRNQVLELDRRLSRRSGVEGCVLLSTRNRTELYLSCGEGPLPIRGGCCVPRRGWNMPPLRPLLSPGRGRRRPAI